MDYLDCLRQEHRGFLTKMFLVARMLLYDTKKDAKTGDLEKETKVCVRA